LRFRLVFSVLLATPSLQASLAPAATPPKPPDSKRRRWRIQSRWLPLSRPQHLKIPFPKRFSKYIRFPPASGRLCRAPNETQTVRLSYAIGSGAHAFGFLAQIGNHLFQSPVSYYDQRRAWRPAMRAARIPIFHAR
jgi:hypothetical protein